MKTLLTAALISATLLGTTAFAQEETEPMQPLQSSMTRAEVQQELANARANGLLFNGQDEDSNVSYAASGSNAASFNTAVHKSSPQAREHYQVSVNGYNASAR